MTVTVDPDDRRIDHGVFVNTLTAEHQEMGLNQIFGRARGMYPAWHIRF